MPRCRRPGRMPLLRSWMQLTWPAIALDDVPGRGRPMQDSGSLVSKCAYSNFKFTAVALKPQGEESETSWLREPSRGIRIAVHMAGEDQKRMQNGWSVRSKPRSDDAAQCRTDQIDQTSHQTYATRPSSEGACFKVRELWGSPSAA
ncbi:hypothetical protein DFH06DRAFT_1125148 [Mycena polygramma]|nr:hypothetical protein DFH06DRAFT_1125148 [Mycena polygramma]